MTTNFSNSYVEENILMSIVFSLLYLLFRVRMDSHPKSGWDVDTDDAPPPTHTPKRIRKGLLLTW